MTGLIKSSRQFSPPKGVTIIRNVGEVNRATVEVFNSQSRKMVQLAIYRTDKLFLAGDLRKIVMCAPYDNHFIYQLPVYVIGNSTMCTCGSIAVMIGFNDYSHLASPSETQGLMLVCKAHTDTNRHADGSQ